MCISSLLSWKGRPSQDFDFEMWLFGHDVAALHFHWESHTKISLALRPSIKVRLIGPHHQGDA